MKHTIKRIVDGDAGGTLRIVGKQTRGFPERFYLLRKEHAFFGLIPIWTIVDHGPHLENLKTVYGNLLKYVQEFDAKARAKDKDADWEPLCERGKQ